MGGEAISISQPGHAKVCDLCPHVPSEENIVTGEVMMDDVFGMEVC